MTLFQNVYAIRTMIPTGTEIANTKVADNPHDDDTATNPLVWVAPVVIIIIASVMLLLWIFHKPRETLLCDNNDSKIFKRT